ncbi:MAG: hypothetical protein GY904_31315 [Planctomycetaceae bacterium]|nr:hypothetical protein [Planctomycetaceae bacterium]
MSALGIIRAVLELIKQLFSYGKQVENDKMEARVSDRRRDKLDWVYGRMSDNATSEDGREQTDHTE